MFHSLQFIDCVEGPTVGMRIRLDQVVDPDCEGFARPGPGVMAYFCERCHVVSPCVVVVHWSQVGPWTLLGTDRPLTTAPGCRQRDVNEVQEVWGRVLYASRPDTSTLEGSVAPQLDA